MTLLSGHQNGKVLSWNVGRRKYASTVADYTHPVTNLFMLPPNGLPQPSLEPNRTAHTIVKPRYDSSLSESSQTPGTVPADYTFNTHLLPTSAPPTQSKTDQFSSAFTNATFPESMIEEGLAELSLFAQGGGGGGGGTSAPMAYTASTEDTAAKDSHIVALEAEIAQLKKKATINETARQASTTEVTQLRSDLVNLHDHINELHQRQEQTQREKALRQARKEARETQRREAWFAAEKKGKKGDAVLRRMEAEESELTSDSDDQSSDEP